MAGKTLCTEGKPVPRDTSEPDQKDKEGAKLLLTSHTLRRKSSGSFSFSQSANPRAFVQSIPVLKQKNTSSFLIYSKFVYGNRPTKTAGKV